MAATVLPAGLSGPVWPLAAVLSWPLLMLCCGAYAREPQQAVRARAARTLRAGGVLGLACWFASPWAASLSAASMAPEVIALTALGLFVAAVPSRRPVPVRVLLAGSPSAVSRARAELEAGGRHEVVGVCLVSGGGLPEIAGVPVHRGLHRAADLARDAGAEVLLMAGRALSPQALRRLQWRAAAHGVRLCLDSGLVDVAPARTRTFRAGGLGLIEVRHAVLAGPLRLAKEGIERLLATVALVVLLPVMLVLAAVVVLDSPGAPIFRQRRIGRDGEPFTMLKFRTMCTTAEMQRALLAEQNEAGAVLFKIRQDPRITRAGAVLRRYSLDELPQLWNVVAGEMSLVGPRPALPDEVVRYDVDARRRLAVKPGITGLWQVSGRSDLGWEESVRLDVQYVDNWSPSLDVSILCRTVRAVIDHRGAY